MLPHEAPPRGPGAILAAQLQASIPLIHTERLSLRAPRVEDFQAYVEIADGPGGRFLMELPSRKEAWFDFTHMISTWFLRGHGIWTVEPLRGGTVLGFVLLGFEPGDHEPELGYMFRKSAQGCGFATEAATAARDYAFRTLKLPTLVSTIDDENIASIRVAERLGATRDPAAEAAHANIIRVYRHEAPGGSIPSRSLQVIRLEDQRQRIQEGIDRIDEKLFRAIGERLKYMQAAEKSRASNTIPHSLPSCEAQQSERLENLAHRTNLNQDFVKKFLEVLSVELNQLRQ